MSHTEVFRSDDTTLEGSEALDFLEEYSWKPKKRRLEGFHLEVLPANDEIVRIIENLKSNSPLPRGSLITLLEEGDRYGFINTNGVLGYFFGVGNLTPKGGLTP